MTWQLVCLLFVTCRRLLGKSREPPLWGGKQLLGKKTTLTCILHTGSDIFTPLQSQLWLRTDFYIWLATVVGCICPWPGNRPKVARSAEKDAVWWIGFSWCSDSENPPPHPAEVQDFRLQSCYRIRPYSALSAWSTYCNTFTQKDRIIHLAY